MLVGTIKFLHIDGVPVCNSFSFLKSRRVDTSTENLNSREDSREDQTHLTTRICAYCALTGF